jgi:hypothetical protein
MRGWKRVSVIYDTNKVNELFAHQIIADLEENGIEVANDPELRQYKQLDLTKEKEGIMPLIYEIRRVKTRVVLIMTLANDANIIHSLFLDAGAKPGEHVFFMSLLTFPHRYYDLWERSYADKVAELALGYI